MDEMTEDERVDFYSKCDADYHYFSEVVMGYHDMNEIHKELSKFLSEESNNYKMCLLPRLTFKSTIITQGYSLWRMFRNPNIRILIYSDATVKSQGFLRGIKNHIEGRAGNSLWKSHLGNWKGDLTWNENQIVVNPRKKGSVEPTIDTSGIDASKVGMHYDLIIFDDIVSDVNVTNKQQMDKVFECYKRSLSLLTRNGEIVIVGTRWHFGDMYGKLIAENKETKLFKFFIKDAEETREDGSLIFDNIGEQALTQEHLDRLKEQQGSYVYSCLYRNNPVDDEDALFKSDNFKFYGRLKKSATPLQTGLYDNLYITGALDPAGQGKDRTGGTICGTDHEMNIHILEVLSKHLLPNQIVDWIIDMQKKFRMRQFGIETKLFQGMLKKELEKRIKEEQIANRHFGNFGIKEFSPSKGETKFIRISALQPWHERGDILFPGSSINTQKAGFSDLAHQMMQVTPTHMPEPNDILDSLQMHLSLVQAGGIVETEDVPENSPAWLEKQWVEQWNRNQTRLPRRRRFKYKTWLS